MGKLITLIIVATLGLAAWQWISGEMECSRLDSALRDVADMGRSMDQTAAKESILSIAQKNAVNIKAQDIHVDVSFGQNQSGAQKLVQGGAIRASSKKLSMTVDHAYKVLGMTIKRSHQLAPNYTVSAELVSPRSNVPGD